MGAKKNNGNGAVIPIVANESDILTAEEHNSKPSKNKVSSRVLKTTALPGMSEILDSKELLRVLTEVKNGNFSVRLPIDEVGVSGKICDAMNEIISLNEKMMNEFTKAGN